MCSKPPHLPCILQGSPQALLHFPGNNAALGHNQVVIRKVKRYAAHHTYQEGFAQRALLRVGRIHFLKYLVGQMMGVPCCRLTVAVFLFCCLNSASSRAGTGDTVRVFFPIGVSVLDKAAQQRIDSALAGGTLSRKGTFVIVGYADYLGSEGANMPLSRARAKAVQQYLVRSGLSGKNLSQVIARGEVPRAGMKGAQGFAPDRRVDIVSGKGTTRIPEATGTVDFSPKNRVPPAQAPVIREQAFLVIEKKTAALPADPPAPPLPDAATELQNTAAGKTVVMRSLYFPRGSHNLLPQSLPQLAMLHKALTDNPRLKIRVEGHVCCIDTAMAADALDEGTGEYGLSVNRAKAIAQELVKRGIAAERIQSVGFGKRRALFPKEQNQEEAERNRRVEIRVLAK